MVKEFVETEIPVKCRWCQQEMVLFLGVQPSSDSLISLVLCQTCDRPLLPLVRKRVIAIGRLEERDDHLVWVPLHLVRSGEFEGRTSPTSKKLRRISWLPQGQKGDR
jgi:hypothetical protein